MNVSIEQRKIKDNKISLRLAYYHGYEKTLEGKIKNHRTFEKLDLFLYGKPKNAIEKQHNKDVLQLAESIKAKRIVEAQSGKHGFTDNTKMKASFFDYFQRLADEKGTSKSNYSVWTSALKHLKSFHQKPVLSFAEVTPDFLKGFREYIKTQPLTKSKTQLSQNAASTYFNKIRAAINQAYQKGIFPHNPLQTIKGIKPEQNKREYLTLEELKVLAKTECRYPVLKRGFLFSCLTGLRWSDINKLTWSDVQAYDGGHRIIFNQQKTNSLQYLDISEQAYQLMGDPAEPDDRVFMGLKYSAYHNTELLRWCLSAGISKHITFHSGRHTFAVIQLTIGTDIYTVSKLLGHSELKTTQIYADIIDAQRKEAMHKIPEIGI